jgi:hypothetical protein
MRAIDLEQFIPAAAEDGIRNAVNGFIEGNHL